MGKRAQGSMTVEMSFLMPMVLFLIMGCILAVFYYHDKNILSGAAYETAVAGSTKAREKGGVTKEELEQIEVTAAASGKGMKVSVSKRAAVTDPEKYIRNMRRLK